MWAKNRSYGAYVGVFALLASMARAESPRRIIATWTDRAPVIDGRLDDTAWATAKEIGGFVVIDTDRTKPDAPTFVKVVTDGKSLFVGFRCVEPRMDRLKAQPRERDSDVWQDDSVEVIIDPTNAREKLYHLIANAAGSRYDGACTVDGPEHAQESRAWSGDWQVATSKGVGEWYAEWRIPFEVIGLSPEKNPCVGINLARFRFGPRGEYSSLPGSYHIFANPAYLGELVMPAKDGAYCLISIPRSVKTWRGVQGIEFAIENGSASPTEVAYVYRVSGPKETWGRSEPISLAGGGRQAVSLPVSLPDTGSYRLNLQLEDARSGKTLCAVTRQLDVRPDLKIEEILYDLYAKKASAEIALSLPPDALRGCTIQADLLKPDTEKPIQTKTLRPPFDKPIRVSFDLARRPKGTYFIEATVLRGTETLASARSRAMPYNPKPQIGFDGRGFMLVEGKPYFPVGIYTLQDRGKDHDSVLAEARKAGFNTTVFYAYTVETVTPLLDAAARHGIKAFVYPTIPFSVREKPLTNEDAIKDVVARRDHPALLGWYLVDEPEGIGKAAADPTRDLYQTVKETDTDHPCSLVIMSPRAAGEYADCADVIWIDPYPIPSSPVTYVSDCTGGAVAEVGNKPVWTIPQAFDWNIWRTGKIDKVHRPTPEEERCMTYLALVHGAKGIIYWAHTGSRYYIEDYPQHWAAVKKLAGEMRDLSPALLTLDSKRKLVVTPKEATIDTMVKELDGRVYVFAVNRDPEPCSASFALPGVAGAKVEALFEGRTLQARGGSWSDGFKPLEVHVYRLTQE